MAGARSYEDPCGVARALDVVGERWALLVVRELLFGPKRFTDLRAGLPTASQNVLSTRLRELEEAGVVRKRKLPPPAASSVYELTERGAELRPVLFHLARWGSRGAITTSNELSTDALVLAMLTTFDRDRAAGLQVRAHLRLGPDEFRLSIDKGLLDLRRGNLENPDVTIEGEAGAFRAVLFGLRELDRTDLIIKGDEVLGRELLTLFPRPTPGSGS
ncbi:winged helix-turn-helix transcriptional regulator [Labedaea rhizosphaerae]|uniref:HxlR family transcriptional regulator n=1 Tax=Labedaea rhizosphaerae TaxID=598644 RepID=A0A4R6RZV9_LABRH|nr:helix-turn-helix domain-containing protein [Labedaea rhizosphaerae]TDP92187.1 HxlR family transcriptional regulator [Labedaea rhizosphaerae]